jgi:hypothetical protein
VRPRHRSFFELVLDDSTLGRDHEAGLIVVLVRGRHDRDTPELELFVHHDRSEQERSGERRFVLVFVEHCTVELRQHERRGRRRLEQHAERDDRREAAVEQLELQLHEQVTSAGASYEAAVAMPGGFFI